MLRGCSYSDCIYLREVDRALARTIPSEYRPTMVQMISAAWSKECHDVRSLRRMQLTHPPIRRLQVQDQKRSSSHFPRCYDIKNTAGVRISDVLEGMLGSEDPQESSSCGYNRGGRVWVVVPKTVDDITGWEMLEVLGN